jgi:hypothetical protein
MFKNVVVDFRASIGNDGRAGLVMSPRTKVLGETCRTCENKMKSKLTIYRKYPQNWHMTLGYFKPGTKRRTKEEAIERIYTIVDNLIGDSGKYLSFLSPQICTYQDHRQYVPLFG